MGIVNSAKKAYISFLMSVFLISSIAALAYIGVFNFKNFPVMPNFILLIAFVAVFSTLFLLIFLLLNLKRRSSRKKKAAAVNQEGNLRPLSGSVEVQEGNLRPLSGSVEVPTGVTRHQNGLLAAAFRLSPSDGIDEMSGHDVIYEKDGVPYIDSDLAKKSRKNLDGNFVKLVESVTGTLLTNEARSRPCLYGHGPQPSLQGEGSPLDRAREDIEGRSPLPPPVLRQQDKPDKAHNGRQG
jgi:hypothetical protein